jgi:acyl-coenzyme A synthetase/AMP-(fatty) acid ligase
VWSGDVVRRDADGFLYFIGRRDETIKTSGYRVSPTEIEDVLYASGLVGEAAAVGVPHPLLGQAIVAVVAPPRGKNVDVDAVEAVLRRELPAFMVPQAVEVRPMLPRNANGKIDRADLARTLAQATA